MLLQSTHALVYTCALNGWKQQAQTRAQAGMQDWRQAIPQAHALAGGCCEMHPEHRPYYCWIAKSLPVATGSAARLTSSSPETKKMCGMENVGVPPSAPKTEPMTI
eukprot:m.304709 g.304709  ORF g.304709 m.304709 type:complete len:106 (-) comp17216_c0_seq1:532-849(-)